MVRGAITQNKMRNDAELYMVIDFQQPVLFTTFNFWLTALQNNCNCYTIASRPF